MKDNIALRIKRHDQKVAAATLKRASGKTLTRHERWLLSFEDAGLTPEECAASLADVVRQRGNRCALSRVNAIQAMAKIVGDEAPAKVEHEHTVTLDSLLRQAQSPDDPPALEA